MNLKWYKGLDKQQEVEMKVMIAEARPVLKRLKELLDDELEASVVDMSKKDNYFMPSWAEYQADRLGEQRALRHVIKLIED